jgi:hypothetical protein
VTNLVSLSTFLNSISVFRYLRQPALVLAFIALWVFFPPQKPKKGFGLLVYLYFFFCLYLAFNTITSIDPGNSAIYSVWMLGFFFFFYQLYVVRNSLNFKSILFQFATAVGITGGIFIISSYVGGYGLGIDDFFDERYNYTLMRMTTEFAGIFGSNNFMGLITYLTVIFLLILFELTRTRPWAFWFLIGAAFHTGLLFFIGNRASMASAVASWALYILWVYRSLAGTLIFAGILVFGFTIFQEVLMPKLRLEQFEGGNILGNRSELIGEALTVVEEMDFFGVGYHNQKLSRKHFDLVAESDKEYNFHNTYLAIFTELGYFGFLWIPFSILIFLFTPSLHPKDPVDARLIRLLKSSLLVMILFYLPVEDSVNSPGSPSFIIFWSMFFILGIGLFEKPTPSEAKTHEEEKNSLSQHTV